MSLIKQQIESNSFLIDYEKSIIEKYEFKKLDQMDVIVARSSIDRMLNNTPYFDELAQLDEYRFRVLKSNINHYKTIETNQARHIVNYCHAVLSLGVLNYTYNLKTGSNVNYGVI